MKVYTLHRRQLIRRPRAEVFRFFERPENLERITPSSLGFHILTPSPIPMHPGAVLDYTIYVLGIPVRWTTLIGEYDPPRRFCDIAIRGPYSFWHHTHTFDETAGGTQMTDEVRYALPFGPIGRLVNFFWVGRQLTTVFDYRAKKIAELLGSPDNGVSGKGGWSSDQQ